MSKFNLEIVKTRDIILTYQKKIDENPKTNCAKEKIGTFVDILKKMAFKNQRPKDKDNNRNSFAVEKVKSLSSYHAQQTRPDIVE